MKTIKETLAGLFFIFIYSLSSAQMLDFTPSQWIDIHKNEIKGTSYIIEGNVIKQKDFRTPNYKVFTCYVMSITKIFKGSPQIKLGTIKVIGDDCRVDENGVLISTFDCSGVGLAKGYTYIIFGDLTTFKPDDTTLIHSMATDNIVTLNVNDKPICFFHDSTARWDKIKYSSWDSAYYFLKENGLTVQDEIKQK